MPFKTLQEFENFARFDKLKLWFWLLDKLDRLAINECIREYLVE